MKNKKLIKHELIHLEQHKREGLILFGLKYIYYHLKLGYWKNPYEIEARKAMGVYSKKEHLEFRKLLTK